MTNRVAALVATHAIAFGGGYYVSPKPQPSEVTDKGWFTKDTTTVLRTTVESLREENSLLVFSYKGTAQVRATRSVLWLFGGRQELSVPAVVNYYLPLNDLTLADVTYDERAKLVTVRLPKLAIGDVAFQPEGATTVNGGLLTFDDDQVEALRKLNYAMARRAMAAQAQQPGLVNSAKRQAIKSIQNYFEIPLRIAGLPDVKVVATFS